MSLYGDYCKEKGWIVVETQRGFMSAIIHEKMCYVENFYVRPEYRGSSSALQLTLQIIEEAKDRGCTDFAAEVYKSDPLYHYIVRLHRHFGMSVIDDNEFKTVTSKRI